MNEGKERKIETYPGSELICHPEKIERGRRVYVEISENGEKIGFLGSITNFDEKNKILFLSSFDGKESKEVSLNEKVIIKFLS